jgi:hypothetical protein
MLRRVQWVISIVGAIYAVGLGFGLATGRVPVRDERGRLRPVPAALVAIAAVALLGAAISALLE